MDAFLAFIGVLGFIVGIVLIILGFIKKRKYKGGIVTIASVVVFIIAAIIGVSTSDSDTKAEAPKEKVATETKNEETKKKAKEETKKEVTKAPEIVQLDKAQQAVLDNANDFEKMISLYNDLEPKSDQSQLWDNGLYKTDVEWTGTVMEVGIGKVYIYGVDGYNGQTWDSVSEEGSHDAFNVFIAKVVSEAELDNINPGDKVKVKGTLKSRGDYEYNYNWKLYDAKVTKEENEEEEAAEAQDEAPQAAAQQVETEPEQETEFFANCTDLRGTYPNGVPSDHPAYQAKMDRDKDNYACETN